MPASLRGGRAAGTTPSLPHSELPDRPEARKPGDPRAQRLRAIRGGHAHERGTRPATDPTLGSIRFALEINALGAAAAALERRRGMVSDSSLAAAGADGVGQRAAPTAALGVEDGAACRSGTRDLAPYCRTIRPFDFRPAQNVWWARHPAHSRLSVPLGQLAQLCWCSSSASPDPVAPDEDAGEPMPRFMRRRCGRSAARHCSDGETTMLAFPLRSQRSSTMPQCGPIIVRVLMRSCACEPFAEL